MLAQTRLGFIGFGEAAFHMAKGLRTTGLSHCFAFDVQRTTLIEWRAQEVGTALLDSSAQLAQHCDLIFSLVTASSAVEAAQQTFPFLADNHIYVDLNSTSPATKQIIESQITPSKAQFVEGAIMSPVPPHAHKVPILLTGLAAKNLVDKLAPFGMNLQIIEGQTGAAAAVKMCRSIVVKGLEALLFECTRAASVFGAEDRVFESLGETFPNIDWSALASYMIGRVVVHGERRAHEMQEVAATLRAINIEPIMSAAAAHLQASVAQLDLKTHFSPQGPAHYRDVINLLNDH